jgi:hypothetical protein
MLRIFTALCSPDTVGTQNLPLLLTGCLSVQMSSGQERQVLCGANSFQQEQSLGSLCAFEPLPGRAPLRGALLKNTIDSESAP